MKPRVRKPLAAVALIAALVFILTGCIHMNMSIKINKDESVDWSYEMLMADSLTSMASAQGSDWTAEASTQAEGQGFKVEKVPSNSDGYSGIKASKHYASLEEFNNDKSKLSGTEGTAQGAQSDLTLTKDKDGTINFSMKMDASQQFAEANNQEGLDASSKEMMKTFMDQMQVNITLTLPFKATTHNATTVSGDGLTYTWKMDLTKANDVQLTAKPSSGIDWLLYGGIAAAGAVLIVAIVLIVVGVSKRNKAKAAAEQQPPMA